jgi:hypothetical protein
LSSVFLAIFLHRRPGGCRRRCRIRSLYQANRPNPDTVDPLNPRSTRT